jgi:2-isopropylmalate synthase
MSSRLRKVRIFDTTLRDGEQSPGAAMNPREKLLMARQLEALGVDVIEAGFPAASNGDFEAVSLIAREVRDTRIAAIARAKASDIDRAWEALHDSADPLLNVFISTSDIHLRHQLKKSRQEVLDQSIDAVKHASSHTGNVEFSAMDATRSDRRFLCRVLEEAIAAGARTVSIADTVGYAVPEEFGALVTFLLKHVANMDRAVLSVHCHDDLGLAVANTLAAVRAGAGQVKCTINGIGERAGNAALEEVVMAMETRRTYYRCRTHIKTEEICKTSRLLTQITGIPVQPNKAIVGANAFAHASGIHQDGLIKDSSTYEIIEPSTVGAGRTLMVLGKHSGRRALHDRLARLGHNLTPVELDRLFPRFKELADKRKVVTDEDLNRLLDEGRDGGNIVSSTNQREAGGSKTLRRSPRSMIL